MGGEGKERRGEWKVKLPEQKFYQPWCEGFDVGGDSTLGGIA